MAIVASYQLPQAVGTLAKLGIADAFGAEPRAASDVAREIAPTSMESSA